MTGTSVSWIDIRHENFPENTGIAAFLVKMYGFSVLFRMFWVFLTRFPAFLFKVNLIPYKQFDFGIDRPQTYGPRPYAPGPLVIWQHILSHFNLAEYEAKYAAGPYLKYSKHAPEAVCIQTCSWSIFDGLEYASISLMHNIPGQYGPGAYGFGL